MVDVFVRSLLGPWGARLLDAYLANSLWINGLILLYFAVLVISRWNYRRALTAILVAIEDRYSQPNGRQTAREMKSRLAQDGIPWEKGLQAGAWPLIAGPRTLLPRPKSARALQQLFPADVLAALYAEQVAPVAARHKQAK